MNTSMGPVSDGVGATGAAQESGSVTSKQQPESAAASARTNLIKPDTVADPFRAVQPFKRDGKCLP